MFPQKSHNLGTRSFIRWNDIKRKGNPYQAAIKPAMLLPEGFTLSTYAGGKKVDILYDADYVKSKIEAVIAPLTCSFTKTQIMVLLDEIVDGALADKYNAENCLAKKK